MDTRRQDERYVPLYTLQEVARYVRVKPTTLRDWGLGHSYPETGPRRDSGPLFILADLMKPDRFSFMNLVESHILLALRQTHQVSMTKVRRATDWMRSETRRDHPLAELSIETDGLDIFVRHLGQTISASEHGQVVIREVMQSFLQRVERDEQSRPVRFYPFTREVTEEVPGNSHPKRVVIDPSVCFGRPVIAGTRIATATVFDRYSAGESLLELADDFGLELDAVEEALRSELEQRKFA